MTHDVFISHAKEDNLTANTICKSLESEGISCWIAPRNVGAGAKWEQAIMDAVSASRANDGFRTGVSTGSGKPSLCLLPEFGRIQPVPAQPYRVGGARIGFWFVQESKRMAQQGKTAQEIVERLDDLQHVLRYWRDNSDTHPLNLPSDQSPEYWKSDGRYAACVGLWLRVLLGYFGEESFKSRGSDIDEHADRLIRMIFETRLRVSPAMA